MFDIDNIIKAINKKEHLTYIKDLDEKDMPCFIDYGDKTFSSIAFEDKFIYIYVDYNEIILGPIFDKDEIGCPNCFKERRAFNKRKYEYRSTTKNVLIIGQIEVDALLMENLIKCLFKRESGKKEKNLFYYHIDWENNVNLYSFWPIHSCNSCMKQVSEDDDEEINKAIHKTLILDKYGSYYPPYDYSNLKERFSVKNTDSNFFIYREYSVDKFFSVSSYFRLKNKDYYGMGIGSGTELQKTLNSSYFEAFERYGGMHPRGREKDVKYSNYKDLKKIEPTVNPSIFIKDVLGNSKDLIPYTDDTKTNWIKVFSWKDKKYVYVPESFAYYKLDEEYNGNECKIFKGCSNGNAIGGTILDSIYYGCMEIVERDAFLNHWYLQHQPKVIDISSIEDSRIKVLIKKLEKLGYKVFLYDIRIEEQIPTIWAFCEGCSENQFATYCTAAANHNPISAILSALHEMLLALEYYNSGICEIKNKALKIKEAGVKELTDHPILYALESEKYLFDFLPRDISGYKIQELYSEYFNSNLQEKINLSSVVVALLDRLTSRFGDVFIVRQTPIGYRKLNLELVKILIPNIQQLWFGEDNRMISSTRIEQVRKFWGLEDVMVNIAPHPFP